MNVAYNNFESLKTPLKIVFFHEVGHYVAHQLNLKHFGIGEIDKILLIEKRPYGRVDYQGMTIPKASKNKSKDAPLKNLPEKVAELIYGCYFQSLYLSQELKICFDYMDESARGYMNFQYLNYGLAYFKIDREKRMSLFLYLKQEYFNALKQKEEFRYIYMSLTQ